MSDGEKYIETRWLDYAAKVLPADAPAIQKQECRRAFYAGATAFYMLLMRGLGPGSDADAGDMAMMEAIDTELREFANLTKAARA